MNYANRYRNSALADQSYLPFKVQLWQLHQAGALRCYTMLLSQNCTLSHDWILEQHL